VARALATLDPAPDVVALQEVETASLRAGLDNPPQLERLIDTLHDELWRAGSSRRYDAVYFPAHRYGGRDVPVYTTGLAILVGQPLAIERHNAESPHDITHRRFRLSARFKQTRVCAHARIRIPGAPHALDLFNTHLSLPAFLSRDFHRLPWRMGHGENQLEEARALLAFVEATGAKRAVLVGDFNSAPDSPAYRQIVASGALRDAFRETVDPNRQQRWATNGILNLRLHIDHVFSSAGIQWLDFDASHAFGERGSYDGISDHVPKIGRLRVA
jgi:endonuclease/exonuclease/phosphatase family metal-dependent hydrolase